MQAEGAPITLERDSVFRFLLETDQTPGGEGKRGGMVAGEPVPSPEKLEDPKGRQTSVNDQEARGVRLVEPGLVWLIIRILDGTFAI